LKEGKTEALKRIHSQIIDKGEDNCLVPYVKLLSDEIMSETLSGKRALIDSIEGFKGFLSNRAEKKEECGFYLAEKASDHLPFFMLFNKKFDKQLKDKMDLMYEKLKKIIS